MHHDLFRTQNVGLGTLHNQDLIPPLTNSNQSVSAVFLWLSWLWSSVWSSCCVTCSRFWRPTRWTGNTSWASCPLCWFTTPVPSPAWRVNTVYLLPVKQLTVVLPSALTGLFYLFCFSPRAAVQTAELSVWMLRSGERDHRLPLGSAGCAGGTRHLPFLQQLVQGFILAFQRQMFGYWCVTVSAADVKHLYISSVPWPAVILVCIHHKGGWKPLWNSVYTTSHKLLLQLSVAEVHIGSSPIFYCFLKFVFI